MSFSNQTPQLDLNEMDDFISMMVEPHEKQRDVETMIDLSPTVRSNSQPRNQISPSSGQSGLTFVDMTKDVAFKIKYEGHKCLKVNKQFRNNETFQNNFFIFKSADNENEQSLDQLAQEESLSCSTLTTECSSVSQPSSFSSYSDEFQCVTPKSSRDFSTKSVVKKKRRNSIAEQSPSSCFFHFQTNNCQPESPSDTINVDGVLGKKKPRGEKKRKNSMENNDVSLTKNKKKRRDSIPEDHSNSSLMDQNVQLTDVNLQQLLVYAAFSQFWQQQQVEQMNQSNKESICDLNFEIENILKDLPEESYQSNTSFNGSHDATTSTEWYEQQGDLNQIVNYEDAQHPIESLYESDQQGDPVLGFNLSTDDLTSGILSNDYKQDDSLLLNTAYQSTNDYNDMSFNIDLDDESFEKIFSEEPSTLTEPSTINFFTALEKPKEESSPDVARKVSPPSANIVINTTTNETH